MGSLCKPLLLKMSKMSKMSKKNPNQKIRELGNSCQEMWGGENLCFNMGMRIIRAFSSSILSISQLSETHGNALTIKRKVCISPPDSSELIHSHSSNWNFFPR